MPQLSGRDEEILKFPYVEIRSPIPVCLTIAFTAQSCTEQRGDPEVYFFATLLYQLATNFPSIQQDVNRTIRNNPALLDPDNLSATRWRLSFANPSGNFDSDCVHARKRDYC
ncbi:hypothetical protein BDR07DRAFT_1485510 [Suillus spraguei]|nr:hypothetical protein BDR07DRAFT_1485510 [Suillus spraguei]